MSSTRCALLMALLLLVACHGARRTPPRAPDPFGPGTHGPVQAPSGERAPAPGDEAPRRGDEIVVCGRLFHAGTRTVLWGEPGGFDAYRPHRQGAPEEPLPSEGKEVARYGTLRRGLAPDLETRVRAAGWRLEDLQDVVSQVVIHYDAAGTSAQAFHVLHDVRGLSAHFLLDLDGTVYQALDLKERAWHAAAANDRSVGIEIANPGAYEDAAALAPWHALDEGGLRFVLPEGVRRGRLGPGPLPRPARPALVHGAVHGEALVQIDYTEAQYRALARLLATLCRVFPRVRAQTPRDAAGTVLQRALGDEALAYEGFVGHHHLTSRKVDPGPAFDWERVLADVRALLGP